MAVENDADRLAFFSDDDFGVVATITLNTGQVLTVSGIYDAPSLVRGVTQGNGYDSQSDISGNKPQFRARSSDLALVKAGRATVEVPPCPALPNGGTFTVHDAKSDGTGLTCLQLMKA